MRTLAPKAAAEPAAAGEQPGGADYTIVPTDRTPFLMPAVELSGGTPDEPAPDTLRIAGWTVGASPGPRPPPPPVPGRPGRRLLRREPPPPIPLTATSIAT